VSGIEWDPADETAPIPFAVLPAELAPPPPRCLCSHLLMLHKINTKGERAACSSSACGCKTYRDAKAADR
jgi:hypothetical protein